MLGWKLEAFTALGLKRLRTKARRQRFAQIMNELKGLNGERNTAVHGEWLPGGTGVTFVELAGLQPLRPPVAKRARRGSSKASVLKVERLEALAAQLDLARAALSHFFMEQWIRPKVRRSLRRRPPGKVL